MKHFSSNNVSSIVVRRMMRSNDKFTAQVSDVLIDAIGIDMRGRQTVMNVSVRSFIFDGDRGSAHFLSKALLPSEFRVLVDARKWYKRLDEQFNYRSPAFWTYAGDFVYTNLNSGKSVVFIDGHCWD